MRFYNAVRAREYFYEKVYFVYFTRGRRVFCRFRAGRRRGVLVAFPRGNFFPRSPRACQSIAKNTFDRYRAAKFAAARTQRRCLRDSPRAVTIHTYTEVVVSKLVSRQKLYKRREIRAFREKFRTENGGTSLIQSNRNESFFRGAIRRCGGCFVGDVRSRVRAHPNVNRFHNFAQMSAKFLFPSSRTLEIDRSMTTTCTCVIDDNGKNARVLLPPRRSLTDADEIYRSE